MPMLGYFSGIYARRSVYVRVPYSFSYDYYLKVKFCQITVSSKIYFTYYLVKCTTIFAFAYHAVCVWWTFFSLVKHERAKGMREGRERERVADARYRNAERTKLLSSRVLALFIRAFAVCYARTPLIIELLEKASVTAVDKKKRNLYDLLCSEVHAHRLDVYVKVKFLTFLSTLHDASIPQTPICSKLLIDP